MPEQDPENAGQSPPKAFHLWCKAVLRKETLGFILCRLCPILLLWGPTRLPCTAAAAIRLESIRTLPAGPDPCSLDSGDFDGDGNPDIAIGGNHAPVHIHFGDGKGNFTRDMEVAVPHEHPNQIAAGDLDGDGVSDLVITSHQKDDRLISILLFRPGGVFERRQFEKAWPTSGKPMLRDFDGDGHLDFGLHAALYYVDSHPGFGIWTGDGHGRFGDPIRLGQGFPACAAVSYDLNGDGRLDLVTAYEPHTVRTLMAQRDGSYALTQSSNHFSRGISAVLADFDRDGLPDFAGIQQHRDVVSLFRGQKSGGYGDPLEISVGNLPSVILTADFDGDGMPDLATANWQSSDLTLLRNTGDGSSWAVSNWPTGAAPLDLVAVDLNKDGMPDLICVNQISGNATVLLNRTGKSPNANVAAPGGPVPAFGHLASPNATSKESVVMASSHPLGSTVDSSTASMPVPLAARYHKTQWTSEQGLPVNSVTCLLQGRDGFLWVGTLNGLARFDGKKFRVFDRDSNPSLNSPHVLSLAEDLDGSLLIGTRKGLFRLRNGRIQEITPLGGIRSDVDSIVVKADGKVWVNSGEGLFGLYRDALLAESPRFADLASRKWHAKDFLGFASMVASFRQLPLDGAWPHYRIRNTVVLPEGLNGFLEDGSGSIWFGNIGDVYRWEAGRIRLICPSDTSGWYPVNCLAPAAGGGVWVGTTAGVRFIQGDRLVDFDSSNLRLSSHSIKSIIEDADGVLWLGTASDGLIRLRPSFLTVLGAKDGLASEDVWSITQGRDGRIWVGTGAGIHLLVEDKLSPIPFVTAMPDAHPRWAIQDGNQQIWAGGSRVGLQLRRSRFEHVQLAPPAPQGGWISAALDQQGILWVGTQNGLHSLNHGVWAAYPFQSSISGHPSIIGIVPDDEGHVWVGTTTMGLFALKDGKVRQWTSADGLTSNHVAPAVVDPDGTVWIVSDRGINRLCRGRITGITTAHGLSENIVYNILDDRQGRFWLSGNRGIHCVLKQELNELAEGRIGRVEVISYGVADGMPIAECNGGFLPNSCRSQDGKLWFPTTKGLVVLDPEKLLRPTTQMQVQIEQVLADDQVVYERGAMPAKPNRILTAAGMNRRRPAHPETGPQLNVPSIQLPPKEWRRLEFHFTAPAVKSSDKTRYLHRLTGHDSTWQDDGGRRSATYARLEPGRYRFEVQGPGGSRAGSTAGDVVEMDLLPMYYQTIWFRSLCGAISIGLIFGCVALRFRHQRRIHALERVSVLEEERRRIARDMHDDLGASLTRITLLSHQTRRNLQAGVPTDGMVDSICRISSQAIDEMGELLWATNPKYDSLENLFAYLREYAAKCFSSPTPRCKLDFPEEVPDLSLGADFRRQVFLVLKEAINNIQKHSCSTQVVISAAYSNSTMELTISDNGIGFDEKSPARRGNGLGNLEKRISHLRGTLELETAPGKGARLLARIPVDLECHAAKLRQNSRV